jgi:hypothetical protein
MPNPALEAIKSGAAPRAARMAAAKGMLPLTNEELLEALIALLTDESADIRAAAAATLEAIDPNSFAVLAADPDAPPEVLGFLCLWGRAPRPVVEAAIFNRSTPDQALAQLATRSDDPAIIEAISLKQQSLIRSPEIIEAILSNPARSAEAERRAREVRQEFFEKEFGAQLVAEEKRAKKETITIGEIEDLVRLGLIEEDVEMEAVADYIAQCEAQFGPLETAPPEPDYQEHVRGLAAQIFEEASPEEKETLPERVPIFQRIALMSVKDRVVLALRGTREARMILIRDPNRMVAAAVLQNPRLTESEVESIAAMKTLHEDILRQIGQNRTWTRSYGVIHNLVRNPRTPIAISLGFLNRLQTRDLKALSTNRNVPEVIRTAAARLYIKRSSA